jgi:acyl dehydratase
MDIVAPGEVVPGKPLGSLDLVITPRHVERYETAIGGGPHAPVSDRGAPGERIAPLGALSLQPFRFIGYRIPNRPAMNVRVEWAFERPLVVGETVRLSAEVVERYEKGWRERVAWEMTGSDAAGATVLRVRPMVSYPIPGMARPAGAASARVEPVEPPGEPLPAFTRTVTREMSAAIFTGGNNYHTDPEAAKAMGFAGAVVGGPHMFVLMSEHLTALYGARWTHGGRIAVTYLAPVVVADTLTLIPRALTAATAGDAVREVAIRCENQRGELVSVATVTLAPGPSPTTVGDGS